MLKGLVILNSLNIGDVLTTLKNENPLTNEINPLMRFLLEQPILFVFLKISALLLISILFYKTYEVVKPGKTKKLMKIGLISCIILLSIVIINNSLVLF